MSELRECVDPHDTKPRLRPRAALVLLLAAQLLATLGWIARDRFPSGFDSCEHLLFARRIADDLDRRSLVDWAAHHRRKWTRATGVHLAVAPFVRLWPHDDDPLVTALAGGASMVVLALACFLTARHLADARAGWQAAALVLVAPGVWGSARTFGMDLPLAAGLAALAAWLTCRPPWASARATAAAGLAAGLLCLIKAQAVFWVPWLVLAARPPARRVVLFGALAALGSAPFWFGSLTLVLGSAGWHATSMANEANAMRARWTPAALAYYPWGLLRWSGLASAPALLVGWLGLRRARDARPLLAAVLGALVVHQLIAVKHVRYLLPAIPLLAVLAAVGLRDHRRRGPLIALALAGGVALQLVGSQATPPAWTGVDAELARAPVVGDWRERTRQLAGALGGRRPATEVVGLTPPDAWGPDDISRCERYLVEWLRHAEVFVDSPVRHAGDPAHFAGSAHRLTVRVVVSDPTAGPAPRPPPGWVEVFAAPIWPAVLPAVGPPLQLAAWIRA